MKWNLLVMVMGLALVGCNQDSFRSTPTAPPPGGYYQAPPPQNGWMPPTQPPPGPNPNQFRPQMPPQMPPQMYPFVPMYQYMQRTPQMQYQWQIMWQQWQQYSQWVNCSPYDFNRFWVEFCPQVPEFQQQYAYLDYSFYYYVDQNTYFPQQMDATEYWGAWDYYPWDCWDNCY